MDKRSRTRLSGSHDKRKKPKEEAEPKEEEPQPEAEVEAEAPAGVVCTKCGSGDHYVYRTVHGEYRTTRYRACRNCEKRFNTVER